MVMPSILAAASVASLQAASLPAMPAARPAAQGYAVVRIVTPALIGADFGPPLPTMKARETTVPLPGGGSLPIRLYEFE